MGSSVPSRDHSNPQPKLLTIQNPLSYHCLIIHPISSLPTVQFYCPFWTRTTSPSTSFSKLSILLFALKHYYVLPLNPYTFDLTVPRYGTLPYLPLLFFTLQYFIQSSTHLQFFHTQVLTFRLHYLLALSP